MHSFRQKTIGHGKLLADQLLQARIGKKLTLAACAKSLDIQEKYLGYLENSQADALPGEAYSKSWIKKYATLLGLDPEGCWQLYLQEKNIKLQIKSAPKRIKSFSWRSFIVSAFSPRSLRFIGLGLIMVVLLTYVGITIYRTFAAPVIRFDQPPQDQKTTAESITVSGTTEIGVQLLFNDKPAMVDSDGRFRQEIPLIDGLNIVTIRAKKKHSREFERTIQVVKIAPNSNETAATSTPQQGPN